MVAEEAEDILAPVVRELRRRAEIIIREEADSVEWPANKFRWPVRDRLQGDVKLDVLGSEQSIDAMNWDLVIWWNTSLADVSYRSWVTGENPVDALRADGFTISDELFNNLVARVPRTEMRCSDHIYWAVNHIMRAKDVEGKRRWRVYDDSTGTWREEGDFREDDVGISMANVVYTAVGGFDAALNRAVTVLEKLAAELAPAPGRKPTRGSGGDSEDIEDWAETEAAYKHYQLRIKDAHDMARSLSRGVYKSVIANLSTRLAINENWWDSDTDVLLLRDGSLNLRSIRSSGVIALQEFDPQHRSTMNLDVSWRDVESLGDETEWDRGIEKIIPDPEVRKYLQKRYGAALLGQPGVVDKSMIWQYGPGDAAKSTIQECIAGQGGVFEKYSYVTTAAAITVKGAARDRDEKFIAYARGKRYVLVSELQEGETLNQELIKKVTGSETVEGMAKYRNAISYKFTATLFASSNDVPRFPAGDAALVGRVHVVPFTHRLWRRSKNPREWEAATEEHRADPEWKEKVLRSPLERAAILRWVLNGFLAWSREGIGELPETMKNAAGIFQSEADPVGVLVKSMLGEEDGTEGEAWIEVLSDGAWRDAGLRDSDGIPVTDMDGLIEVAARTLASDGELLDDFGRVKKSVINAAKRLLDDRGGGRKATRRVGEKTVKTFTRIRLTERGEKKVL